MSHKAKRKNSSQPRSHKRFIGIVIGIIITIVGMVIIWILPLSKQSTPSVDSTIGDCFWNWAYGDVLPRHMDILHTVLADTGYVNYELTASAYGEDYVCMDGAEIISSQFHLMDITPTIVLTVTQDVLNNPSDMGAHIRHVVNGILNATDQLPKIKQINIQFTHNDTITNWSLPLSEIPNGIPLGMTDKGLFELGTQ